MANNASDNTRKKEYIILESRLSAMYKNPAKDVVIKKKFLGKELAGKKYTPLFNYFLKVQPNSQITVYLYVFRRNKRRVHS